MKVVVAPDGFGGTLDAAEVVTAIAAGWRDVRPDDELELLPLSDGGEGLLDVLARPDDTWVTTEVAGPHGHPIDAALLLRADGTAVIESARACGLHLVPADRRTPALATTYGVGELLDAARDVGARRVLVGLGGTATVDGGAGALTGLGFRLTVADGSGLRIGGGDLGRVSAASHGWAADWADVEVVLLADVAHVLAEAAPVFGPQKGANPAQVRELTEALVRWAQVAERDLAGGARLREEPGSGAAGGLGFGLRCALPGARFERGFDVVADELGLDEALADADLVITGEGRLDATSAGKVVGCVAARARLAEVPVAAVVGAVADADPDLEVEVVETSPGGPGETPAEDVRAAARHLAAARD